MGRWEEYKQKIRFNSIIYKQKRRIELKKDQKSINRRGGEEE